MRYTLKDYQNDAVAEVLTRLQWAREDWRQRKSRGAFSLSATTGAGKTVMAAAVIEALFDGNPDYDFDSDPGAVVLWFTDDPSLNTQTQSRLMDASDRLGHLRLKVIKNTFRDRKLEARKVYFLNAQKLGQNSRLVRRPPEEPDENSQYALPMPDGRAFTMWDILANTIDDERLTLYLILDEAHRGMKAASTGDRTEKATIVQRLVNGANGVPPVPIVWGISATVDRFDQAMENAKRRTTYASVEVEPARVQESGLLKDDIRLDFPTEAGEFSTVLLARATRKAKRATELWRDYAEQQRATADAVVPLLVVQVPNKPSDQLMQLACSTIRETWPELEPDAMAHVFGDHAAIELGSVRIPHVAPETVQDRTHIRVLFAKDAISTGWDCPRAEVLVSFRRAKDETHITQLLGRMVRTPLARRVPGNDLLNSVECLLPHFDRTAATKVTEAMLGDRKGDHDGTGGGTGRRVLSHPVDMGVNHAIPDAVWEAFDALPSHSLPRKAARPVQRLSALAQALSRDGLRTDARKEAYRRLFGKLNGLLAQHGENVAAAKEAILRVEGETVVARVIGGKIQDRHMFLETADEHAVAAEFRAARRMFTADLAGEYAAGLAKGDEEDDGLFDAYVTVAALAKVDGVAYELNCEAVRLADRWLSDYRVDIKGLTDERRAVYDEITGMSREPQVIGIKRPRVRTEAKKDAQGKELDTRTGHLMSDEDGNYPVGLLNKWEIQIVDTEMRRAGFQAWYRNPQRPSGDALVIAYKNAEGAWHRMCPDFLFFHRGNENMQVSIVDPHSHHLADVRPKLCSLAKFASAHSACFHRIESVTEIEGTLRGLDLVNPDVRKAIADTTDMAALYGGAKAFDYRGSDLRA